MEAADVAGLEAAVVVVVVVAGLEAAGAFGATDGVCATTREAVANRVVSNKVVCLMVGRFC
jgi:formylmethanofuran dehydrogenase subunit B